MTLSGRPHLQAAHWKISSVVPVNCPSTRGRSHDPQCASQPPTGRAAKAAWTACGLTRTWLRRVLSGRGSQLERWTWPAHDASLGRVDQEPGGWSVKYPSVGGGPSFGAPTAWLDAAAAKTATAASVRRQTSART